MIVAIALAVAVTSAVIWGAARVGYVLGQRDEARRAVRVLRGEDPNR